MGAGTSEAGASAVAPGTGVDGDITTGGRGTKETDAPKSTEGAEGQAPQEGDVMPEEPKCDDVGSKGFDADPNAPATIETVIEAERLAQEAEADKA